MLSVSRGLFSIYDRWLKCQHFVAVSRFSATGKSSGQFSSFSVTTNCALFCLINFRTKKKKNSGEGTIVYSCFIVITGSKWSNIP